MAPLTRFSLYSLGLWILFSTAWAMPTPQDASPTPDPGPQGTTPANMTIESNPNPEAGVTEAPYGRCGANFGWQANCRTIPGYNMCCSQYGWCGDSPAHCGAGCQPGYGNCNAATPPPVNLRPRLGNVPYGVELYRCTVPGTYAMTFDDGPFIYTSRLLDILDWNGVKATFFITGNNMGKGPIDSPGSPYQAVIGRMYNSGHHIAAHTWNHPRLPQLSVQDMTSEMTRLETALKNIIGRYPTYMRPPYSDSNQSVRNVMNTLGYHIIMWDLDTDDYNNNSPDRIWNSRNRVVWAVNNANPWTQSFLSIMHDVHEQTVENLVQFQIDVARSRGFRLVTLGECLGDPQANWYRT